MMAKHGQTEISDGFECLLVSLRVADRALFLWRGRSCKLRVLLGLMSKKRSLMMPEGVSITPLGGSLLRDRRIMGPMLEIKSYFRAKRRDLYAAKMKLCSLENARLYNTGIECLFSEFKSRGCCITKTKHAGCIECLILVLALYWAVSTGINRRATHL